MVLACLLMTTIGGAAAFDIVAKIEEDYVPTWQPVAFTCTFHTKWSTSGSHYWSNPVLVSHSEDFRLWSSEAIHKQDGEDGEIIRLTPSSLLSSVHDHRYGLRMEIPIVTSQKLDDIRVDRHHQQISTITKLGTDVDQFTGFSDFVPVNEDSNTWLDSFVIDTYAWNGVDALSSVTSDGSTRHIKPIASWSCERIRYYEEHHQSTPQQEQRERSGTSRQKSEPAAYQIYFENLWNANSHPFNFPENALFTDQIVVAHNSDYELFRLGQIVTDGFELFVEDGNATMLKQEISESVARVSGGRGGNLGIVVLDSDHDLVSTATRLSPSPDWFTGLSNVRLVDEKDNWLSSFTVDVFPLKAGTQDGFLYTEPGDDVSPHAPVTKITPDTVPRDFPVFTSKDFFGKPTIRPIGQYTFVLIDTSAPTSSPAPSAFGDTGRPTNESTTKFQLEQSVGPVASSGSPYPTGAPPVSNTPSVTSVPSAPPTTDPPSSIFGNASMLPTTSPSVSQMPTKTSPPSQNAMPSWKPSISQLPSQSSEPSMIPSSSSIPSSQTVSLARTSRSSEPSMIPSSSSIPSSPTVSLTPTSQSSKPSMIPSSSPIPSSQTVSLIPTSQSSEPSMIPTSSSIQSSPTVSLTPTGALPESNTPSSVASVAPSRPLMTTFASKSASLSPSTFVPTTETSEDLNLSQSKSPSLAPTANPDDQPTKSKSPTLLTQSPSFVPTTETSEENQSQSKLPTLAPTERLADGQPTESNSPTLTESPTFVPVTVDDDLFAFFEVKYAQGPLDSTPGLGDAVNDSFAPTSSPTDQNSMLQPSIGNGIDSSATRLGSLAILIVVLTFYVAT